MLYKVTKKANLSLFKIRNDEMHSIVFWFFFGQIYTKLRQREVNLLDFHVAQDHRKKPLTLFT
jgi:hypothetical protein